MRRIALVAALIALIPAAFSYLDTMAEPSNSSLGVRSVEWLREHGAAGLVSQVESTYYSLTAPSKGGPRCARCPKSATEPPVRRGRATAGQRWPPRATAPRGLLR